MMDLDHIGREYRRAKGAHGAPWTDFQSDGIRFRSFRQRLPTPVPVDEEGVPEQSPLWWRRDGSKRAPQREAEEKPRQMGVYEALALIGLDRVIQYRDNHGLWTIKELPDVPDNRRTTGRSISRVLLWEQSGGSGLI